MSEEHFHPDTISVRGALDRSPFGETAEALFLTSGFVYESAEAAEARFKGEEPGFIYSRYGNPTVRLFERRLALLEGAEGCYATASGMAAVWTALLAHLKAGDHVVASRVLFGSCLYILETLLPRYGIAVSLVDGTDLAAWEGAIRAETKVFFLETPANPTLSLIDLAAVCALAKANDIATVIDNALASPAVQCPTRFGADTVVYSATKHIDGQGRTLGGAILGRSAWLADAVQPFIRHTGPALSPFNAWVLQKGLETLTLRVEKAAATALGLAQFLETHQAVTRVFYPFLASFPQQALAQRQMANGGTLVAFDLGSKARAFAFLNALSLIDISNNLGDAKSLVTHPATTTHRTLSPENRRLAGITDGLVRLSVGLEHRRDLARDLERALDLSLFNQ